MAFLKRTTEVEKAAAALAKLQRQQTRLVAQEATTREALDAAIIARRKSMRDDEAFDAKAAEAARNADTNLAAVRDTLDDVAGDIDEAQAALAQARDQERRKAEAASRKSDLAACTAALDEFLHGARKLSVAFDRVTGLATDAGNIAAYARRAIDELGMAAPSALAEIAVYVKHVAEGHTPIHGYAPPAPPVPRPVPIPVKAVFALENLRYVDQAGETRTLAKYVSDSLPVALAEKALLNNWAAEPTSHRAKSLIGLYGNGFRVVEASDCIDIATGTIPEKEPMRGRATRYRGAFVGAELGTPVTGTVSVRRLPGGDGK